MAPSLRPGWPTGHALLDAQLPGGGWPPDGLSELLAAPGSGELRLLAPLMRQLATAARGDLVCIDPPYRPSGAALQALGLPLSALLWVAPRSSADAAWAAEQALRGGSAALVLWWCEAATSATLRRLHLVAQGVPLFLLGPPSWRERSSPAPLRLVCRAADDGGVDLDIFKRRGPPLGAPLHLRLSLPAGARLPAPAPVCVPAPHHHALVGCRSAAVVAAGPARLVAGV